MRNHGFDTFLIFEKKIFGGKMEVTTTVARKVLGPLVQTKKLAHWVDLLGLNRYLENLFKKFGYESPS